MTTNLEDKSKPSIEEALKVIKEDDNKIINYTVNKKAVYGGKRPIDKEYTQFRNEVAKYMEQFSQDELFEILGETIGY